MTPQIAVLLKQLYSSSGCGQLGILLLALAAILLSLIIVCRRILANHRLFNIAQPVLLAQVSLRGGGLLGQLRARVAVQPQHAAHLRGRRGAGGAWVQY